MSKEKVRYSGFLIPPLAAWAVNRALKKQGDRGVYGDLSGGLKELAKDSFIRITGGLFHYTVDISPDSGEGHGFNFKVNKITRRIKDDDIVYENVIQEEASDLE